MKTTIGLKIGAGYALAVLTLAALGFLSYSSMREFFKASELVERTYKTVQEVEKVVTEILNVETGQRGFTITQNEKFLEVYNLGLANIDQHLITLRTLFTDPEQQRLLAELEPLVRKRVEFSKSIVDLEKSKNHAAAIERISSGDGKKLMDDVRSVTGQMLRRAETLLKERSDASEASRRRTILTLVVGVASAGLLLALIAFLTIRDISKPLRQITGAAERIASGDLAVNVSANGRGDEVGVLSHAFGRMVGALQNTARTAEEVAAGNLAIAVTPQSDKDVVGNALKRMVHELSALIGQVQRSGIQVNSSATEIAATARQQQAMTGEISSTTSEISATSREISATSQELVKAIQKVSAGAEESARLAGSGQSGLARMEEIMHQITTASGSINTRLGVLSEKSGNINAVVATISKVADQTNLLSLNAAIEAEKAGEQGRGFAVVATEIRRLADQTAVATLDIEQIVKEMQSAVSAGVMGMEKFSEEVRHGVDVIGQVARQLTQIIEHVQALAPSIETVNEGMQSQSQGAQQISEALVQLGEAARQTAESLRQSNDAIGQLNEATHGLQTGVSRFTVRT